MGPKKELKLATQFNIFVILLILVTSAGITLFVVIEKNASSYDELLNRGISLADIISKNSDYSLFTEDKKSLQQLADSALTDSNVAYVAIMNADQKTLVSKKRGETITIPPASRYASKADKTMTEKITGDKDGKLYIDILAPVMSVSADDFAVIGEKTDSGQKTIGYVQIGLTSDELKKRIRNFLYSTLFFTSLLAGLAVIATFLITRRIVLPVNKLVSVAQDISSGKLDHRIDTKQGGMELSSLAHAIGNMSANLRDMIFKIMRLASRVSSVTQTITESPASVLKVAGLQQKSIEQTVASITEMDASISGVSLSSDALTKAAVEASSATLLMTSSVSGVAGNAEAFHQTAQDAASSVEQMVSAIREISGSLEILFSSSEAASSSLLQIHSAINLIRKNSDESVKLSELVSTLSAEKGISSIDTAILGIENARKKVGELSAAIENLGRRSAEIGRITTVIDDVAGQTSLLALNAAIIAAKAGKQGNAFAVVADEIKDLAEKTSQSTKEIGDLITSVQKETKTSIEMTREGIHSVNEGVNLVKEAKGTLLKIMESSKTATDKSRAINRATAQEADSIKDITDLMKKQSEQVQLIARATREQSEGSKLIIDAMEKVRALADQLRRATAQQSDLSKRISQVSEDVSERAQQITTAMKNQKQRSHEIVHNTEQIRKTTEDLIISAGEMNNSIGSLSKDAQDLMAELSKFEI